MVNKPKHEASILYPTKKKKKKTNLVKLLPQIGVLTSNKKVLRIILSNNLRDASISTLTFLMITSVVEV